MSKIKSNSSLNGLTNYFWNFEKKSLDGLLNKFLSILMEVKLFFLILSLFSLHNFYYFLNFHVKKSAFILSCLLFLANLVIQTGE